MQNALDHLVQSVSVANTSGDSSNATIQVSSGFQMPGELQSFAADLASDYNDANPGNGQG